jgi:hypothetical protein
MMIILLAKDDTGKEYKQINTLLIEHGANVKYCDSRHGTAISELSKKEATISIIARPRS